MNAEPIHPGGTEPAARVGDLACPVDTDELPFLDRPALGQLLEGHP